MTLIEELFLISVAAERLGMHPQTLRKYERLGLVRPSRTLGSMRVYSDDELRRIRVIKQLVDEAGINLAGVQRLLSIGEIVDRIRPLVEDAGALDTATGRRQLAAEVRRLVDLLGQ
jgi:MerR family transcriptional regulator/heat shock protein HspR